MDHYYLGYVDFIRAEKHLGRIFPLAIVKKRSAGDAWIVDRVYEPNELGSTNRVFWPNIPSDQLNLDGRYVRFKVESNLRAQDPEDDQYIVAEERRNGTSRRVVTLGLPIVPEDRVDGSERILASSAGVRPGMFVYRRRLKGTLIDGPWRIAQVDGPSLLCLQPKDDGHVVEHKFPQLGLATYHVWTDRNGEEHTVLLVEPEKDVGDIIDLMPDSALGEWLDRMLKRDKGDKVGKSLLPTVGERLAAATDQLQRSRFARLEKALNVLADDEARLADLVESPRFKEVLDAAVGREVATKREQIETTAREETREFIAQQRQDREREMAQTVDEKKARIRELAKVRAEIADAERLRAEARANIEQDQSSIRDAADYLVASQERIIRDFSAFHRLIEHARVGGDIFANGHHPAVAELVRVSRAEETWGASDGPAIDDEGIFLQKLARTMAAWGAEATPLQAKRLHAALLSCRWIAVPCPSWGVAYAEAMGAHARQTIVAAEPTWLAFSDAWGGEVEAFWRESVESRDVLHLLIFADADRALVQCWARPLLDIVSGVRALLPSGLPWPENLRVMACPSADEAALHVPNWVVAHWAGIEARAGGSRADGLVPPGHVSFATWSGWVMEPNVIATAPPALGIASRSAARELSTLARTLERLSPHDDPESFQNDARTIREVDARKVFNREDRG
jgi:hypothetical protein